MQASSPGLDPVSWDARPLVVLAYVLEEPFAVGSDFGHLNSFIQKLLSPETRWWWWVSCRKKDSQPESWSSIDAWEISVLWWKSLWTRGEKNNEHQSPWPECFASSSGTRKGTKNFPRIASGRKIPERSRCMQIAWYLVSLMAFRSFPSSRRRKKVFISLSESSSKFCFLSCNGICLCYVCPRKRSQQGATSLMVLTGSLHDLESNFTWLGTVGKLRHVGISALIRWFFFSLEISFEKVLSF